jgi:hypothetical protein
VLAGIRNTHGRPPLQKEAVLPEDVIAMLETLDRAGLRGLRDREVGKLIRKALDAAAPPG